MTDYRIDHNENDSRFETTVDGHTAKLLYRRENGRIIFTSTQTPPAVEGRGIEAHSPRPAWTTRASSR